jgi:hypothetical protein
VPRCRKAKTYRPPTREENRRAFTGFELDELFDEDEIEDLMAAAKRRVVREFNRAVEPNPRFKPGSDRRKTRRTDNYIWGLPNKPSELAHYVQRNMKRSFLSAEQLPQELTELHPKFVEMILAQTQYNVLLAMWQICQSAIDEFLTYRRAARAAIPKFDERSYHGRVRSQSERRGIPEGTSVGRIA